MGGLNPSSPQYLRHFLASAFLLLWPLTSTTAQYRVESWTTDNGLPQNSVRSIVQTRDGYLWLTTFDGLVRFDGLHFTVFDKSNTKGLSSNRFTSLYEDRDGTLWIGTGDGGLTFYRDGVFRSITVADGIPAGQIMTIARDLNGELLLTIDSNRFYLRDGKFIAAPPEDHTRDVRPYEDSQGNLWLANESGIYRLRDGQITRYREKDGVPPRALLRPVCEDDQGGVWFIGNGLVRFKDGRFTTYDVSTTGIYCIFKDREGTIWVGTANGLRRLTRQFITGYSTSHGLLNNEIYPILQSRNGDIWVGSPQGLSRFRDGKFKNILLPQSTTNVQALGEDSDGNLWVGIIGGLLRFKNGKLKDLSSLLGNTVSTILTDRNGNVWVGCANGLFKFNEDRVVAHYTTKDGLPKDDVTVIHEDRNGNLWTGTSGALAQFKDGRFTPYRMADSVATNHIWTIYEDNDGTFWIGTYDDGLIRFRDGRFLTYKKENGLFDNGVFQILEDRHGYFWISCNRGIYRVSRQELNDFAAGRISRINSVAYGKNDGMLNIECNGGRLPAGIKTRDGKFWFPTQAGVAIVDTEAVPLNPHAPPVLIESVTLERQPVDFRSDVTVEPGQQNLEISYTGLDFIKSDQVRFKFKLEGLNTDWIDAGTRRTVHFPYLPPGTYTFRIIAANSDGVWNEAGASFNLIVRAPFWRHSWFWVLCAVTIAAITAFVMWGRLVQLKRRQAEREAFARQLIESQEGERKRLARELHDSLAQTLLIVKNWALVGLSSLAQDNPAREHLTEISDTTSLALSEVREIAHNLRPPQLDRLGLTNTIEEMVRNVSNSSDIEFIAEIDNIDGLLSKESEINLFRVVQECVNNVLKHSAATKSWLSIKRTAGGAEVICRDNGRGFDPGARVPKRGIGLIGIAERVRMLGGNWTMEAAIGKGATICIMIGRTQGG